MTNLNSTYTNLNEMLKELSKIDYFYICPGGRNKDIFEILKELKKKYSIISDERSAAFMALGHSKKTLSPVAVVTTSGTAVGECLPAVMEAFHSSVKLVVVSFDRPDHIKKIRSAQTTHQEDALKAYTFQGKDNTSFPKHLNYQANFEIKTKEINPNHLSNNLVIVGRGASQVLNFTKSILERNYFYFELDNYNEVASFTPHNIRTDEILIKMYLDGYFSNVFILGELPDTQLIRVMEKTKFTGCVYISNEKGSLYCSESTLIEQDQLVQKLEQVQGSLPVIDTQKNFEKVRTIIEENPKSEIAVVENIVNKFNLKKDIFFFSNSLPIRSVKYFKNRPCRYFFNRGLNGIDGILSTAFGVANSCSDKVILFIGDLSFLYDLNVLMLEQPTNLFIYIINNGGGEIFRRYGLHPSMKNKHSLSFKNILNLPGNIQEICIDEIDNEKLWKDLDELSI
jgi:2-succinyl-5-enolpyruvyl-6-hydroxy-3-cyclohexene-1-carboxylate synthase